MNPFAATPSSSRLARVALLSALLGGAVLGAAAQPGTPAAPPPLVALPSLAIEPYMGTWYQVAWFPNRFQKQCVSDTAAQYRLLPGDRVEVVNRCKLADGRTDTATGLARPAGSVVREGRLAPAQLEVSFLPAWLRWVPAWGRYWVIDLADDGRYAVVSEPQREYLWVLARAPRLAPADESAIRSKLLGMGFDLARWQAHPHTATAP